MMWQIDEPWITMMSAVPALLVWVETLSHSRAYGTAEDTPALAELWRDTRLGNFQTVGAVLSVVVLVTFAGRLPWSAAWGLSFGALLWVILFVVRWRSMRVNRRRVQKKAPL